MSSAADSSAPALQGCRRFLRLTAAALEDAAGDGRRYICLTVFASIDRQSRQRPSPTARLAIHSSQYFKHTSHRNARNGRPTGNLRCAPGGANPQISGQV